MPPKRPRITNTTRKKSPAEMARGSLWSGITSSPRKPGGPPTLGAQARTPGGPLGGNQPPGQPLGSRQFPDRYTPLPAGNTMCTLLLSERTQVPLRKASERSFVAPCGTALSGGQGLGVLCPLPDPTRARSGHCALTRDDQGLALTLAAFLPGHNRQSPPPRTG